jgi:uncharacterized RDD family membrane protein YckC
MKCPKCGYLGFEHVERCRNCGYEFSLTSTVTIPDIVIREDSRAFRPLDDLSLIDAAAAPPASPRLTDVGADLDRLFGAPEPEAAPAPGSRPPVRDVRSPERDARPPAREARPSAAPSQELTLFGPPIPDDEPLITKASPPRPPLSVRRATPEVPRLRSEPRLPSLDLALDAEPDAPMALPGPNPRATDDAWRGAPPHASENAAMGARFAAVVIDLLILAVTDVVVVYFTMQICGLSVADLGILPKGPLLAFLLVQNGGYLVAFTAGGQTLGKMAAGIRIVTDESESSLDLGRAFLRTMMWLVLAVPAGLGFLTAFFSSDHRGLHDRFAGTRVVR